MQKKQNHGTSKQRWICSRNTVLWKSWNVLVPGCITEEEKWLVLYVIWVRITTAGKDFFGSLKFFKLKPFSMRTKLKMYMVVIRPIFALGYEVRIAISVTERSLKIIENTICRKNMWIGYRDARAGRWYKGFNHKLKEESTMVTINRSIKTQGIRWLGYAIIWSGVDAAHTNTGGPLKETDWCRGSRNRIEIEI